MLKRRQQQQPDDEEEEEEIPRALSTSPLFQNTVKVPISPPSLSERSSSVTTSPITTTTTTTNNNNDDDDDGGGVTTNASSCQTTTTARGQTIKIAMRKWGSCIFVLWLALLIGCCICLTAGYNNIAQQNARGAESDDFVPIGRKCQIQKVNYRTRNEVSTRIHTGKTAAYECWETWQYEFVVNMFEEEEERDDDRERLNIVAVGDQDDASVLHSIVVENEACSYKPCHACSNKIGKNALSSLSLLFSAGDDISANHNINKEEEEENSMVECWSLQKDVQDVHPFWFWSCSNEMKATNSNRGGYKNNNRSSSSSSSCFLLQNPHNLLAEARRPAMISLWVGWILLLFVTSIAVLGFFAILPCSSLVGEGRGERRGEMGEMGLKDCTANQQQ